MCQAKLMSLCLHRQPLYPPLHNTYMTTGQKVMFNWLLSGIFFVQTKLLLTAVRRAFVAAVLM